LITINIEPTSRCNARCSYCMQSQNSSNIPTEDPFLPLAIHQKFFSELGGLMNDFSCMPVIDTDIYLRYCGVGEPTLHPDFIRMFKEAISFPKVKILAVLSNGSGWNRDFCEEFLEIAALNPDKLVELVFSLDTLRSITQYKIKKLENIDRVISDLRWLLDMKAKRNLRNIHPVFQMIILEENHSEAKEFLSFWSRESEERKLSWRLVSDSTYTKYFASTDCFIWFKLRDSEALIQKKYCELQNIALKEAGFAAGEDKAEKDGKDQGHEGRFDRVCSMLWYGVNLSAKGLISPCCIDVDFQLKIGNCKNSSLSEIYSGQRMRDLRLAHINGNLNEVPLCATCCLLYKGVPASEKEVLMYLDGRSPQYGKFFF